MLIKVFKVLFFSLSILLIGAHALVPHQHGDMEQPEHNLPDWLDYLADAMSNNLGDEHLEEYEVQTNIIKFSPVFIAFTQAIDFVLVPVTPEESRDLRYPEPHLVSTTLGLTSSITFRGPPQV